MGSLATDLSGAPCSCGPGMLSMWGPLDEVLLLVSALLSFLGDGLQKTTQFGPASPLLVCPAP